VFPDANLEISKRRAIFFLSWVNGLLFYIRSLWMVGRNRLLGPIRWLTKIVPRLSKYARSFNCHSDNWKHSGQILSAANNEPDNGLASLRWTGMWLQETIWSTVGMSILPLSSIVPMFACKIIHRNFWLRGDHFRLTKSHLPDLFAFCRFHGLWLPAPCLKQLNQPTGF
jgi:hypothetical protein